MPHRDSGAANECGDARSLSIESTEAIRQRLRVQVPPVLALRQPAWYTLSQSVPAFLQGDHIGPHASATCEFFETAPPPVGDITRMAPGGGDVGRRLVLRNDNRPPVGPINTSSAMVAHQRAPP
jgi:hypothetical protein